MAQKKVGTFPLEQRRPWIESNHGELSIAAQCRLTGVSRSGLYYTPVGESAENIALVRLLDEQYTRTPYYGIRRMTWWLKTQGRAVNAKRVRRLLRLMGLEAIYPKPRLSAPAPGHRIYPYRLRDLAIVRPDQVWATDITYIRLRQGFIYLVAIMDWFSRYVLAWEVSTTMDSGFCVSALDWALTQAQPEIFNSDQGAQFTSDVFTRRLEDRGITISWTAGAGSWTTSSSSARTVKYEEVYLKDYLSVPEAISSLNLYFRHYNRERGRSIRLSDTRGRLLSTPARGLWKLTQLWKSAQDADSPSCLKTASQTRLLSLVTTGRRRATYQPISTAAIHLKNRFCCPKNGECPVGTRDCHVAARYANTETMG